jgi:hypothetical protein
MRQSRNVTNRVYVCARPRRERAVDVDDRGVWPLAQVHACGSLYVQTRGQEGARALALRVSASLLRGVGLR